MVCPHCLTAFHDNLERQPIGEDKTSAWFLHKRVCPACGRFVLSLREQHGRYAPGSYRHDREILCYPKGVSRAPLGPEVPVEFADDYREACLTLPDSAKASAALSRRCLQHLLRESAA